MEQNMQKDEIMQASNFEDSITNITRFVIQSSKNGDESSEAVVNMKMLEDISDEAKSFEEGCQTLSQVSEEIDVRDFEKEYHQYDINSQDICYVIGEEEFFSSKFDLIKHSQYFKNVIESCGEDRQNYRILLPKWIEAEAFQYFINYLQTETIPEINLETTRHLIWISSFFRVEDLIK